VVGDVVDGVGFGQPGSLHLYNSEGVHGGFKYWSW
jgi:hypothetical protein